MNSKNQEPRTKNRMSQPVIAIDPVTLDASADLQTILAAWHTATLRLEQTHDALRDEVRQLTAELEVKNRELARRTAWPTLARWPRTWPTRSATTWCR